METLWFRKKTLRVRKKTLLMRQETLDGDVGRRSGDRRPERISYR